jgi:hypothetical protein
MATPTNLPAAQTTGNVLTAAYVNDLRGAFRVLQFFSVQGNTSQTTTSTTYGDITSLSITITPQATTNKIFLMSANNLLASGNAADAGIRFLRDGTAIYTTIQAVMVTNSGSSVSTMYLDSPSSTSAITYKVQFNRASGTGTVYSNVNTSLYSSFLVAEISA